MEIFNPKSLNFNFAKYFNFLGLLSALLVILSLGLMFYPGLNYGIDFRGGIEAQVQFKDKNIQSSELKAILGPALENVSVLEFKGSETNDFVVVSQNDSKDAVSAQLTKALTDKYGPSSAASWTVSKLDVVGRKVGADFRKDALLSLIYTCLLVTLYMYWRFDMRFTPGALACIFHDLALTTGFLVLTKAEFTTTIVAALLTLAGYSINDTVVVFDRIRETEHKFLGKDKRYIVNDAINSTLSRTIMTAGTTLISCLVLYFVAGTEIQNFAMTLFVGILIGTYSSAFVAAPLYVWADRIFGNSAPTATPKTSGYKV